MATTRQHPPTSAVAIANVETLVLRAPESDPHDLDSSSGTVVVIVRDEDGRAGIGEADAPARAVRELVLMEDVHGWSRGLRKVLLGRDPFEIGALHDELYAATIYHGRRGLGIHALSAVDVALHDLVGKQLGRPVYQLLGGARRDAIEPYATIYPGAARDRTIVELMDDIAARFERALELGFRAVKMGSSSATSSRTGSSSRASRRDGGSSATKSRCWSTSATAGTTGGARSGRFAGSRTATSTSPRPPSGTTTWTATRS
jgi:L-alanine-DL-glutamate epimerase-like enolase superfamily enzyme